MTDTKEITEQIASGVISAVGKAFVGASGAAFEAAKKFAKERLESHQLDKTLDGKEITSDFIDKLIENKAKIAAGERMLRTNRSLSSEQKATIEKNVAQGKAMLAYFVSTLWGGNEVHPAVAEWQYLRGQDLKPDLTLGAKWSPQKIAAEKAKVDAARAERQAIQDRRVEKADADKAVIDRANEAANKEKTNQNRAVNGAPPSLIEAGKNALDAAGKGLEDGTAALTANDSGATEFVRQTKGVLGGIWESVSGALDRGGDNAKGWAAGIAGMLGVSAIGLPLLQKLVPGLKTIMDTPVLNVVLPLVIGWFSLLGFRKMYLGDKTLSPSSPPPQSQLVVQPGGVTPTHGAMDRLLQNGPASKVTWRDREGVQVYRTSAGAGAEDIRYIPVDAVDGATGTAYRAVISDHPDSAIAHNTASLAEALEAKNIPGMGNGNHTGPAQILKVAGGGPEESIKTHMVPNSQKAETRTARVRSYVNGVLTWVDEHHAPALAGGNAEPAYAI